MGITVTKKAAFERKVYRKNKNGQINEVEVGADEYGKPGDGEKRVRITGYSDSFEMTGQYGPQIKVRIEFLVVEGKWARTRFDTLMTLSIGKMAKLGQLAEAALNREIEVGEEFSLDDLLGLECYVVTEKSESAAGYTNINLSAVRALDDDDSDDEPAPLKKSDSDFASTRGRRIADAPAHEGDSDDDAPPY